MDSPRKGRAQPGEAGALLPALKPGTGVRPERTLMTPDEADEARAERDQAVAMRLQGMSYNAIAQEMGRGIATIHRWVSGWAAERGEHQASIATMVEIEAARLDALAEQGYRHAQNAEGVAGWATAAGTLLKISEARRRLYGLDAPQRVDIAVHAPPVYEVVGVDVEVLG